MNTTTEEHEYYSELVIECPAQCADRGCPDHQPGEWRKSKRLDPKMNDHQAKKALRDHAREFPNSGPYRLVRRTSSQVTTTTTLATKEK